MATNIINSLGPTDEALENGELSELTPAQAGIKAPPDHHIFPQEYREWFAARGINVDQYTVTLDEATHRALHYGGGPGKGGGWWNNKIMSRLSAEEARAGRSLTPDEIMAIGRDMMKEGKIDNLPIHPYNSGK